MIIFGPEPDVCLRVRFFITSEKQNVIHFEQNIQISTPSSAIDQSYSFSYSI